MSRYINPKNPPAKLVYARDGQTFASGDGWTVRDERKQLEFYRARYNMQTADGYRPICIVRLKAWK